MVFYTYNFQLFLLIIYINNSNIIINYYNILSYKNLGLLELFIE